MTRWFNIAGPCFAQKHYLIPAERRARHALELIARGLWFSLVSGPQTGKTTVAQSLASWLNARGERTALCVDLDAMRQEPDPKVAFLKFFDLLRDAVSRVRHEGAPWTPEEQATWLEVPTSAVGHCLRRVYGALPGVVLFLDNADALEGAARVSFLTQLRALYLARRDRFEVGSVVFIGVRPARDYATGPRDRARGGSSGPASPFNVTVEDVELAALTEAEVGELTAQHTAETGQRFEAEAVARVFAWSAGHPWLVNALCDRCTRRDGDAAVTAAHVEAAREAILQERGAHLEGIVTALQDEGVRRLLDAMIRGARVFSDSLEDDLAYAEELGLVAKVDGWLKPANPIYRELVPRALTAAIQEQIAQEAEWYVRADGTLDVPKLMGAWQTFWREDGHLAAEGFSDKERGPHLMLMAFLQRVVNGGGRIEREYALGKGALDLLVLWRVGEAVQRVAIEVKLRRDTETEDEALEQVRRYLEAIGEREGWLVMFDLRATTPWSERVFTRERAVGGCVVRVVGC